MMWSCVYLAKSLASVFWRVSAGRITVCSYRSRWGWRDGGVRGRKEKEKEKRGVEGEGGEEEEVRGEGEYTWR